MSDLNLQDFEKYIKDSYLSYSCMVLSGRALSYVQDGFKPVHRRILFAMSKLSMSSTSSFKKSARVVGDVIGKYHPHGDTSVYEAMVRMSQPWSVRYPLVDGQGNFGSREGDNPAAMRYTEVRTTPLTDSMLAEINLGSVGFKANFDGSLNEPEYLPGPLPILLLNGSTGIAVGMAADLPSHNVKEVADATIAYIKDNDITVEGILEHLKGPDLPTGGQIVDSKEHILNCYATGKGNLHVRARWEIETLSHGQWRAVITELPQDMSPKDVLELVANASVYEVPKGEKPNQRMLDLKQYIKINIDDIKDITSKDDPDGSARMLIEPKSSRNTDPDEFMLGVVSMLGLQSTLKFNLTTVSTDLFPRQRNIKEIITDWVEFRRRTITLRTETRLAKIIDRLELVRGRLSIMDLIDEVIEIIRTDDEPQQALMQRFSLTERQANDILEIKLRELRKLEEYKLQEENDKLEKEKSGLDALLASKVKMNNLITREINTATEKMADERRTLIKEEKTSATVIKNIVPADPITLWFTKDNWLVGRKSHIPDNESPTSSLKPGDNFSHHIQAKLTDNLIVLGKSGRIYNIAASAASFGRGSGIHLSTLINLNGDSVQWVGVYEEGMKLLLSHSEGYGFVIEHQNLVTKQKAGKECFKLSKYPSASIADVIRVREETPMVNIWTNKSRFIQFNINEINDYPKSQGMRLVSLAADETMKGICLSESEVFLCDGVKKRFDNSYLKKRAAAPKKY